VHTMIRNGRGRIVAVCVSSQKGVTKAPVGTVEVVAGHGIKGDAHAGNWHRQISLLDEARIDEMRRKGLDLAPGAFGENLVTTGIDLDGMAIGDRVRVGRDVLLEVTQRGKECHDRCAIYHRTGDCIMPRHGLFARVIEGGEIGEGAMLRIEDAGGDQ